MLWYQLIALVVVWVAMFATPAFFYLIIAWIQLALRDRTKFKEKKYVLWMIVLVLMEVICIVTIVLIGMSGTLS